MGSQGRLVLIQQCSLGAGKANAMGLEMRNLMKSPMQGDGRVIRSFVNLVHSVRMCSLVSMFDWPHGHVHVS